MPNAITAAILALIKDFEGLRTRAYADPATGGEPWTIGYGHTGAAGPPAVARGMRITPAFAEAILVRDLETVAGHVAMRVKVPITDNQFGALVSFAFNCGIANFDRSTLLAKLNAADFDGAADEFARWNRAAGRVMAGLSRRRAAERALFRSPARPAPRPPKRSLSDWLRAAVAHKALDTILNQAKELKMLDFLTGYKTYIVGLFMIVAAIAQIAGVDLPSLEGQNAGQLLLEAFAIVFLRKAIKSGA